MPEHTEQKRFPLESEKLGFLAFMFELIQGVGLIIGMGLLWFLEAVRNVFFRMLDRLNIKPRPRKRASAFPPGSPRRQTPA